MEQTMETTVLDVRPMLAAGGEPFDVILDAARKIGVGATLELVAPFDPVPLYAVLDRMGFTAGSETMPDGSFVVRFRQTGIAPATTVAQVAELAPAAVEVLGRHGIDLCCGGPKPLEFVATAHGVPLPRLISALREAAASA